MDGAVGMDPPPVESPDHLGTAPGTRAASDSGAARASLVAEFEVARATGDSEAMAIAALAMPTSQRFGVHPGQIPALLHEAYVASSNPLDRCRLASALARSWVYGGDAARAHRFAEEAQRLAAEIDTPEATVAALEAALVAHWGPGDFAERVSLAARLEDVTAHLLDVELRLSARLWRLTTAWECLDIVAVHRQLRALELLAEESDSARVAFFSASRRGMHALTTDDLAAADKLIARTAAIGADLAEPDVEAVLHELSAMRAQITGDLVGLRDEAEAFEAFGAAEGIPSISAVGATLWLAAGEPDRSERLILQLMANGVDGVPRDVDYLLVISSVVGVAAALGLADITREAASALEPFAGRGVLNAGAVTFHGVVDDYLHRARHSLGDGDADRWRHGAASAYRRIGAGWWERTLNVPRPHARASAARSIYLRRNDAGGWTIGAGGATFALADLRGLHYLRYLVQRPNSDIEALALSAAVAGHPTTAINEGNLGEVLDSTALAAYRRRLSELDAGLDAADHRGNQVSASQLSAERDALIEQLRGATSLGGRRRRPGGSAERARIAVRKAITAALSQVDQHDPGVARVLRDTVRTGTLCRYEPDPDRPVTWTTE